MEAKEAAMQLILLLLIMIIIISSVFLPVLLSVCCSVKLPKGRARGDMKVSEKRLNNDITTVL